jgi:hypothetical protein
MGTLLLAILAIFGENVNRWFFKPRIFIELNNEPPFVDNLIKSNSSKGSYMVERSTVIKIKVNNRGNTTALNCQGLVEEIWSKHSANENYYLKRSIVPSQLEWHNNQGVINITPRIPTYLEIARIQVLDPRSKAESTIKQRLTGTAELFLSINEPGEKGIYIKLANGTFLIPIILYGDNLSEALKYYIELYWIGNDPKKLEASNFYIRIVENDKLTKEIIK